MSRTHLRPARARLGVLWGWAMAVAVAAGCGGIDDRPARWSYISPAIIQPACATASCHSAQAKIANVQLDTVATGYCALVGPSAANTTCRLAGFVFPGNPLRSKVIHLLRADEVRRMPRDAPLPDADIELIERWILAGAKDD